MSTVNEPPLVIVVDESPSKHCLIGIKAQISASLAPRVVVFKPLDQEKDMDKDVLLVDDTAQQSRLISDFIKKQSEFGLTPQKCKEPPLFWHQGSKKKGGRFGYSAKK